MKVPLTNPHIYIKIYVSSVMIANIWLFLQQVQWIRVQLYRQDPGIALMQFGFNGLGLQFDCNVCFLKIMHMEVCKVSISVRGRRIGLDHLQIDRIYSMRHSSVSDVCVSLCIIMCILANRLAIRLYHLSGYDDCLMKIRRKLEAALEIPHILHPNTSWRGRRGARWG